MFTQPKESLAHTTLLKMSVWIVLIVIGATLIGYWQVRTNLEAQTLAQLERYVTERGQRESTLFLLAQDNQRAFRDAFVSRYHEMGDQDPQTRFEQLFEPWDDGTLRTRPELFYGFDAGHGQIVQGITGFVGQGVDVTPDTRRRLVVLYELLRDYGPAWRNRFPNLYVGMFDNTGMIYWPEVPWDLDAPADYDTTQGEFFYLADPAHNPGRWTVWTGVYYDEVAQNWMVSCLTPIDRDGQYIATIGTDVLLNDLLERTVAEQIPGAFSLIFHEDGQLIAHPEWMAELEAQGGALDMRQSQDAHLERVFDLVEHHAPGEHIVENREDSEYLAVTRINGPDWYFVTVYPKTLITEAARMTAQSVLFLGALALIVEIVLLFTILHRQIVEPLRGFVFVTGEIARGKFAVAQSLPLDRNDEIGRLAYAFHNMVTRLQASFEQVQTSEERFKLAMEANRDGLWDWDIETGHVYYSPGYTAMLGYSMDSFPPSTKAWENLLHPDDKAATLQVNRDCIENRRDDFRTEFRMRARDGAWRWVLGHGKVVARDETGRALRMVGTHTDITERKHAEDEIMSFKKALDASSDAVGMATVQGRHYYQNQTFDEMFGDIGIDPPATLYVDEEIGREVFATIQAGEEWAGEVAMYDHNHGVLDILLRAYSVKEAGRVIALVGVHTDITERKRAEAALRESEARNRAILNAIPDLMFIQSRDGTYLDYHAPSTNALYTSPEQFLGKKPQNFMPEAFATKLLDLIERAITTGETQIYDYQLPISEQLRFFEARIVPYGEDRVLSMIRDITERQRAEAALRESEAQYRTTLNAMGDAIHQVNADLRLILVNQMCREWVAGFGLGVSDPIGLTLFDAFPVLPSEVCDKLRDEYHRVFSTGKTLITEETLDFGGQFFVTETRKIPVFDEDNQVSRVVTVIRDITERQRAEAALRDRERQYRNLFNGIPDAVFVHNLEGKILDVNHTACTKYGYSREELQDMRATNIDSPEQALHIQGRVQKLLHEGGYINFETVHLDREGHHIPMEVTATLTEYQGQDVIIAICHDVTDRKRAEEAQARLAAQVREQAQQMKQILATVPEGVLLLNTEGRVLRANPVAESDLALLSGVGIGEVLTRLGGRPLAELLTSPPTKGLWHEIKVSAPSGERTFEVIARPVENGPEPEYWVLVSNDVTREREVRAQLQQQQRLAAVGQLAAGIAHDFNNIMATIVLYARMMDRAAGLSDRDRERLDIINRQAWHASQLIEQILDFSRRAVLERRPLDLLPLLKEQVKLLTRTLPEHIDVVFGSEEDACVVDADPTRMQQMLTNLAVNARDAMPQGGNLDIELTQVTVTSSKSAPLPEMAVGAWVRLTVSDTGSGIASDVLPHIFEPFFTTKKPGQGSGLGLAQVYGIVKQHEGQIDVSTQVGAGSTFTIYLPALQEHQPEVLSTMSSGLTPGHGETLLVVEDDALLRQALVDSLEALDYRTLEAPHGHAALDLLDQHAGTIALVLSDLVMPEMGGQALFHALQERGLTIPVVILSGHPMENELESLEAQGLAGWMLKPPDIEKLSLLLGRILSDL